MTETEENFEKIRLLLSKGNSTPLPKHELTNKLLRNLYRDEEASIISTSFDKIRENFTVDQISEKSGVSEKEELKKLLDHMVYKGTLLRGADSTYYMMSYLPGIFEAYFIALRDTPERLKEAGKAHRGLRKFIFMPKLELPKIPATNFNNESGWRFVPAMEPVLKTIEINKGMEIKNEILPYEILEHHLSKYKVFSETVCSCREAAKLAAEPCKRTTENFCIQAGDYAKHGISDGTAKELSYEDAMKRLKAAEKDGLVHSTANKQEPSMFVCNCCSCCCMALAPVIQGYRLGVAKSNFDPVIDNEKCIMCDTCIDICPMGIIEHQENSEGEKIIANLESCLGCGLCASNCPEDAIFLEKARNNVPHKTMEAIFS
jgi:Pyruvate/2-oxoacid:ferredoxin oxidoreductase delta subunit